jgi:hypothetical protein
VEILKEYNYLLPLSLTGRVAMHLSERQLAPVQLDR